MEVIGIVLPLIVVWLTHILLSGISRTLADIVVLVMITGPVLWSLNELRKAGRECFIPANLGWTIRHLVGIAPAAAAVYWFNTDHKIYGTLALLVYGLFAQGTWLAIFTSLKFSGASGDDEAEEIVERGARVVDARGQRPGADETEVSIGGVPIPRMLEAQHFLITGTTGAGKTQVISAMLRSVRKRGNRAVIADPAGGFYSRFARPGDVLFNPFDSRSVDWSPFAEIREPYDCERIARAVIPDGTDAAAEWHGYGQSLFAQTMLAMHRNGERSIKRLLYWLTTADAKELGKLLAGTPAAAYCSKGATNMLGSIRGVISSYLTVFQYLPDEGHFSFRQWIQEDWRDNWLFVTYRDSDMALMRYLVAAALEMSLVEGLSLTEDQERGLWYVMDEVDSLGKVSSLRAGLTKLRKYGGRCVLGLQTISQLRTTYGRDEAQTLIANTSVKCILRAGDAETAKSMEHELGEQQIRRRQVTESISASENGTSQSQNTSNQVLRQSAVLAAELMGLPDLHGYLKLPGADISRIDVVHVSMPEVTPAFA